jgi:hypothetical protein
LYLFKVQPIYSRGFTPILGTVAQFFSLFEQIYVFTLDVEEISKYYCLFSVYFYFSGLHISLILIPIHLFRYIAVSIFSKSKISFYQESTTKAKVKSKFPVLLLKCLQNPIFNALVVVFYWMFIVIIFTLVYVITVATVSVKDGCFVSIGIMNNINYALVILFIIIYFILLIADVIFTIPQIISCKPCKCDILGIFRLFWTRDPFSFRFEFYIIGTLLIVAFTILNIFIVV